MKSDWVAIVLAAGQGTRMKSPLPKVLHTIAGRPLVAYAIGAAFDAGVTRCVAVVGHGREQVESTLEERFGDRVTSALQAEQRGTGHAVQCAMAAAALAEFDGNVLILYGDCPLIPTESVRALMEALPAEGPALAMLTSHLDQPTGYGRIVRDAAGQVCAIREQRDCSPEEALIQEVNPGVYAVRAPFLRDAIARLQDDNAQGELYLTDVVAQAAREGGVADLPWDMADLRGVNDRYELALCAEERRQRIAAQLARSGVAVRDLRTLYVDADCEVAPSAILEPQVHLRGRCVIEAGARVDVGAVLTDVVVRAGAEVLPYTVATESVIGEEASVGPFTHLRPATELGRKAKVGNFSETKKTRLGDGSKVNHLSYVGDGVIGKNVNIGAGTIFCNYDGVRKHTTTLEDNVFIGSDSQLVAPVTVGEGAYVASGTTVTRDVPADALAVARTRQQNKEGYAARFRARAKASRGPTEGT
ncbi:MAG: bifunctional UDP-N-acetylglucosamine diphosphorylase/glucosamine-1-phosphate N-acetyltransferase GlmU [Sandaracinaceae bacterium]|nr:bifunctional UDP-N-acetylglucosamine diphosphorylase/glucosamine-1-phosphate N-acetyltransferase GlmU [Myxococcales bacterium]MCB9657384.1 bifunctional UDP-N-acetylglucosamine diphosphorylase/glucosamine-1-phosphate N-acetyltransferase GlmU [Sandaracinaceae bacterium]